MNSLSVLFGVIITFLGLTIFSFNYVESGCISNPASKNEWGNQTRFIKKVKRDLSPLSKISIEELDFYIYAHYPAFGMSNAFGNYRRAITETKIKSASTLEELIEDLPSSWIDKYESVWIKSITEESATSLMSKNEKLTSEQKSLFKNSYVGDFYDIVINFERRDPLTKKVEVERINIGLTVVPEKEARYPDGHEKLISYFKEGTIEKNHGLEVRDFQNIVVTFEIDENGKATHIIQKKMSGLTELDEQVLLLIQDMPNWKPAEDQKGSPVTQKFELIYGRPGC